MHYNTAANNHGLRHNPFNAIVTPRPIAWLSSAPGLDACTVVCGCGGGSAMREALPPLLAHAGRLVLDADALNAQVRYTSLCVNEQVSTAVVGCLADRQLLHQQAVTEAPGD